METLTAPAPTDASLMEAPVIQEIPALEAPVLPGALPEQAVAAVPTEFEAQLAEIIPSAALEPATAGRLKRFGRSAMARAVTEGVGLGVDIGLMAAGGAGVAPFSSLVGREVTASSIDVGLMQKLSGEHDKPEVPPSRVRRIGHFAVAMAAAVVAQKYGTGVVEHISANLSHGVMGHYAVPLASKVGATTGVNSIAKRLL